jgi:hypothetical protein
VRVRLRAYWRHRIRNSGARGIDRTSHGVCSSWSPRPDKGLHLCSGSVERPLRWLGWSRSPQN